MSAGKSAMRFARALDNGIGVVGVLSLVVATADLGLAVGYKRVVDSFEAPRERQVFSAGPFGFLVPVTSRP